MPEELHIHIHAPKGAKVVVHVHEDGEVDVEAGMSDEKLAEMLEAIRKAMPPQTFIPMPYPVPQPMPYPVLPTYPNSPIVIPYTTPLRWYTTNGTQTADTNGITAINCAAAASQACAPRCWLPC